VMLKCKEVSRFVSSGESVSLMKRLEMRMHLLICGHCSRYAKQLKKIGSSVRTLVDERTDASGDLIHKVEDEVIEREDKRSS